MKDRQWMSRRLCRLLPGACLLMTVLLGTPALALQPEWPVEARKLAEAAADVEPLLKKHACTSCHRVERKVVGPAFRDVAKRYAGQDDAREQLMKHIRQGSAGRWGPVPMPPQPRLGPKELAALAAWVMQQGDQ